MKAVPTAVVAHESVGRARLRLEVGARDSQQVKHIVDALAVHPNVVQVKASPGSGSLLVHFHGKLEELATFAADRSLFSLRRPLVESQLRSGAERPTRHSISNVTSQRGLTRLAGTTLIGLAAMQALRGKVLPAGLTLLFQGLGVLNEAKD